MQCNIDDRGKAVRLKLGILVLCVAGILGGFILGGVVSSFYWRFFFGVTAISGGFIIFEARSGWCVIRAMGFKTPL